MAKQVIETRFQAKGGKQVEAETNRIGKAQTRLAQGSASAGRSFAAQSQGLGGVVGVYAAAAANVFALTAAFSALNRAAQFETIIRGTEAFASSIGTSATAVLKSIKEITNGQLTLIESAEQANLALSAGFNTDQISELADVANKASKALGRNLSDSFQRITRGAIKLEPELLDEIGIFTRIEPAVQAYAASVGKSASQLTQFERRQAFVNKVIEDGSKAFKDIDTSVLSTQEKFEKLVANFSDLALITGKIIADSLVPLVDFLNKNVGNQFLLLGSIGLLVFNRLRIGITDFATKGLTAGANGLSRFADSITQSRLDTKALASEYKAAQAAFKGGGAFTDAGRGLGASLKRQLGAGALSTQEAVQAQKDINTLKNNEKAVQAALNKNISAGVGNTKQFKAELDQSKIRMEGLNASSKAVNAQLKASSPAAKSLAGGLNIAAAAGTALASALSRAFLFLNIVVGVLSTAQFVLSFFDIDLFGAISDFIKKTGAAARATKTGLDGLAAAAKKNSEAFKGLAEELSTTGEVIERVLGSDLIRKSDREVAQLTTRLTKRLEKLQEAQAKAGKITSRDVGGAANAQGLTLGIFSNTIDRSKLDAKIIKLQQELLDLGVAAELVQKKFDLLAQASTILSQSTDRSLESFVTLIGTENLLIDGSDQLIFKLGEFEQVLGTVDGKTVTLNDSNKNLSGAFGVVRQTLATLTQGLKEGSLQGDQLDKILGVLRIALKEAKDEAASFAGVIGEEATAAVEKFSRDSIEAIDKLAQEIIEINNLTDRLAKKSGAAFAALDDAVLDGLISKSGKIAKTDAERTKNKAELLANAKSELETLEKQFLAGTAIEGSEGKIAALKELIQTSEKAALGNQLLNVKAIEDQRVQQEKIEKTSLRQLKINAAQLVAAERKLSRQREELLLQEQISRVSNEITLEKKIIRD